MTRTIEFDDVEREIARRMARRIRVQPFWAVNGPYLAELRLVRSGARSASGHPDILWASAATPREAVEQLTAMIRIWLRDPKSPSLVQTREEATRGVGVEPGPPRYGKSS